MSSPRGPFTATRTPSIFTVTPAGTGTGFRPILDISILLTQTDPKGLWTHEEHAGSHRCLPHVAQDFAAHVQPARLLSGNHTLGRGQNRNTHTRARPRNGLFVSVYAAPRLAPALPARGGAGGRAGL